MGVTRAVVSKGALLCKLGGSSLVSILALVSNLSCPASLFSNFRLAVTGAYRWHLCVASSSSSSRQPHLNISPTVSCNRTCVCTTVYMCLDCWVAGPRQSRQAAETDGEAAATDGQAARASTDGYRCERAPNPVCGISATRSFASDASEHTLALAPTHFLLPLLSPGTPTFVPTFVLVLVNASICVC